MNRGFLIILIPAALVATGYIVVLREIGVSPGYGRLAVATGALLGGMWWLGRRGKKKPGSAEKERSAIRTGRGKMIG